MTASRQVAFVAWCVLAGVGPARATNFLVLVLDDLAADKVGAYLPDMYPPGSAPRYLPDTPGIDTLAAAGLRFTTAYANPVCSPSRASILTGRYPHQHDVGTIVTSVTPELSDAETTLPELLATTDPPYESALFGKWHLGMTSPGGDNWQTVGEHADSPNPARHGFVAYRGNPDAQLDDYYGWTEVDWPVQLSTGAIGATVSDVATWASDHPGEDALAWIGERTGPWLAIVAPNAPHVDEEGTWEAWEEDDLAPEAGGVCEQWDGKEGCTSKENFATLVGEVDARVGLLLTGLMERDRALLEDTVVVLVGDNGTPASLLDEPWTPSGGRTGAGKLTGYESGLRVPFVLARGCDWMDLQDGALDGRYADGQVACAGTSVAVTSPGLAIDAAVQVEDVYATIATLAGAGVPWPSASVDLTPCLSAGPEDVADCGVSTLHDRGILGSASSAPTPRRARGAPWGPPSGRPRGYRRGSWKIVMGIGDVGAGPCVSWELYDLASDPYETHDLLAGGPLSAEQDAAWNVVWTALRTEAAPDWLPDQNCEGGMPWDTDGDRYEDGAWGGPDCDDGDPAAYPGATETCDDVDEDCDGFIDEDAVDPALWYADTDADGSGDAGVTVAACDPPAGYVGVSGDCDDTRADVYPGAPDVPADGVDQDCDGTDAAGGTGDTSGAAETGETADTLPAHDTGREAAGCGCAAGGGGAGYALLAGLIALGRVRRRAQR